MKRKLSNLLLLTCTLLSVEAFSQSMVSCGIEFFYFYQQPPAGSPFRTGATAQSDNTILLKFATSNETSTFDKFIIERQYNGATYFTKIGEVENAGGISLHYYTFVDMYPCYGNTVDSQGDPGILMYRIRAISIDGGSCTSDIEAINPTACPSTSITPCELTKIDGPSALCITGDYQTFYATSSVTWTVTPSTGVVNWSVDPGNSSLIHLTKVSDGYVTLTATGASCTKSKIVPVGAPTVSGMMGIYSGPGDENEVCKDDVNIYDLTITPLSTINWTQLSAVPGGLSWAPQNYDDLMVNMWKLPQTAILRLSASNICGTTTYDFGFKTIDCGLMFAISPNPTDSRISVGPKNQNNGNENPIDEISIYDFQNQLKFTKKFNKATRADLILNNLKPGHYFVKIKSGKYSETLPIIVK